MARSMYGAYRAAGKAGGAYRASLQDIENVGYEKEHSAKMYEMDVQSREATLGAITEGISLASNLYGGWKSKQEFGESQTEVQTGMAKTAYGKSDVGKAKGAKKWSELDEEVQSEWMKKFTPTSKEQKWHEKLFGVDKEVRFGEMVKGKEGQDLSKYYSKSDILAEGTLSSASMLSEETGSSKYKYPFNLSDEIGGIDKTKVGDVKTGTFSGPGGKGTVKETYDPVKDTWSPVEEDKTEQGFGFGPSSQMQKMMGIYKGKPKGGWNPSKEDWYQEEFAEGFGWKGGKWQ